MPPTFLDCFAIESTRGLHCGFDATLEAHWVGASSNVAQALVHDGLSENGCGGGAVASYVVGLGCDLFDELSAHVFESIFELNFTSDGNTIVGDCRSAELLVENNVATLGAECDLDRVGELVDARFETATSCVVRT